MSRNPLNAQRRRLRNRISVVYMLPTLLAAVAMVIIFSHAVRSMLVDSAVANTETALRERVQTEVEAFLKVREEKFLTTVKRVQGVTKEKSIRPILYKQTQSADAVFPQCRQKKSSPIQKQGYYRLIFHLILLGTL